MTPEEPQAGCPDAAGGPGGAHGGRLPFFVYGTLRSGGRNHDRLLSGRTAAGEPARLPGAALYAGPGFPYAVEVPDPAAVVRGELIRPPAEVYGAVLADLDVLEGYRAPGLPGNHYERVARLVTRPGGEPVRAWVYLAARLPGGCPRIPGGDWLRAGNGGDAGERRGT